MKYQTIVLTAAVLTGSMQEKADAQWSRVHEQFYLPAAHNWEFRDNYAVADRLFNAFDYGHAILYERLYRWPDAPVSELEDREYQFITTRLLIRPPHVPLEEGAIEVAYAKLAPEAKIMFDWAHLLHRQIYDVLADESLTLSQKDREVARLLAYYKSRPDIAFSSQPKNMELMEGQPYSTTFRKRYPKFNGLIWAYHWLQVGLYEPLMAGTNREERQAGVTATVARFRQMLEDPPTWFPRVMPMTAAVAPRFAERYPEAAIIFDNLHAMHDVISDILTSPGVPRRNKRAEILRAAARYRDDTSFIMTRTEWVEMANMMGIENMGGPVVGFLPSFPKPTVERGAVMFGHDMRTMRHDTMGGMKHDTMGDMKHDTMGGMKHDTMGGMKHDTMGGMKHDTMGGMKHEMRLDDARLLMALLANESVREAIVKDTMLRSQIVEAIEAAPAEHRKHLRMLLDAAASPSAAKTSHGLHRAPITKAGATAAKSKAKVVKAPAAKVKARSPVKPKPTTKAKPKPSGHGGHKMPNMKP